MLKTYEALQQMAVKQTLAGMFYGIISTIDRYNVSYSPEDILSLMKKSIILAKQVESTSNIAFSSSDLLDREILDYAKVLLK